MQINNDLSNYAICFKKNDKTYIQMKNRKIGPYFRVTNLCLGSDGSTFAYRGWRYYNNSDFFYNGKSLYYLGSDGRIDKIDLSIPYTPIVKLSNCGYSAVDGNWNSWIMIGNKKYGLYENSDFNIEGNRVHIAYLQDKYIHLAYVDVD